MTTRSETRRTFYTDGGASPNPGPGGWGVVEVSADGGIVAELSGGEPDTTNNRMELQAAIAALEATAEGSEVEIVTDSTYLRKGMTEWLAGWMARGWKRREGKRLVPIKNEDLWRRLESLERHRKVSWHWVRGHAGDEFNERADQLATREIEGRQGADTAAGVVVEVAEGDHEIALKITCVRGRGAWAAHVQRDGRGELLTGKHAPTTANRLDLEAACALLEPIEDGSRVVLRTGSDYLRNGASQWLPAWKRNRWMTKGGSVVKNQDLWRKLDAHLERLAVDFAPLEKESELAKELTSASKQALTGKR